MVNNYLRYYENGVLYAYIQKRASTYAYIDTC